MKFLFISPRFSGGIGGHAAMLADQLTKNGHQVKKMETTHIPIKNMKNPSFAVLSSLKSIVDRESYDIVHGFNIPSAYAMKYAKGKKKVLSVHGVFSDQVDTLHSKSVSSIAKNAQSQVLQWPDKLTTDSKATKKLYKEKFDIEFEYLPSPLDVPPVEGVKPGTDDTISRGANNDEPFAALAFKTVTDPFIGRLVYFRVYSGSAKSGSSVLNTATGDRERLGRIVKMHADQREDVEQVYAGEIAAAIGLKDTTTGETISSIEDPILLEKIEFPDPVVSVSIEPKARADQDKLSDALVKLSDEDPTFTIIYDDETGQTVMSGMGELHLEILTDRMKREFKVEANVGKPRVAFRETIRKTTTAEGKFVRQSGGHGQYGHVIIEMEPLDRGEGVQFENKIRGGSIPTEFISSVEDGIRGALKNGPKSGFPVIDLLVRLIDGTYHDVDSSKVSFEIAGSMATRTAVDRCSPVVLEPVMKLEVVTPEDYLGEVIGDLGRRRAGVESIDAQGDTQIVKASLPLAESFGYANDLRSITQGRAGYSMEFEKYLEAPESVVESQAT